MYRYTCPTCGRIFPVSRREEAPHRPFCCERCQQIDLGRWLNEEYVISDPLTGSSEDSEGLGGGAAGDVQGD